MSIETISWAFRQITRPRNKLVLILLADMVSDGQKMPFSVEGIARKANISDEKIYKVLSELHEDGFLTLFQDPNGRPESFILGMFLS